MDCIPRTDSPFLFSSKTIFWYRPEEITVSKNGRGIDDVHKLFATLDPKGYDV